MDEVQENEPEKHDLGHLAAEPIIGGYAFEESRCGLNSGLYFDENLEKGFGVGDVSSILYYGLNSDSGAFDFRAFGECKDVLKGENMAKMPSEKGANDLFSSFGFSNASGDYVWDFNFPKKFPYMDNQFPQESESWNSSLVSQSSGSSKNAFGLSELSSQTLDCQNIHPARLTACDSNGNYMTPLVCDMIRNDETGVNSSHSHNPGHIGNVNIFSSSVEASESYHCSNNGYYGTSFSMQSCDASLLEGTKVGDPSLNDLTINKPTYSCDLREFSEVSPVDTNESYQGDLSVQGLSTNKPAYSCDVREFSEVSPVDTNDSYHCSKDEYFGTSHDLNYLRAPLDDNTKSDTHSSPSVLINKAGFSCDLAETLESDQYTVQGVSLNNLLDIDRNNIGSSPIQTRDSDHGSSRGCIGTAHDLELMGKSFNSMFMEFSPPSLDDEDREVDDPLLQDHLISNPQDMGEFNSVASPVDSNESRDHGSQGNGGNSSNSDFNPRALSCNSLYVREADENPCIVDTEEDDPTLLSILMKRRAECRKNRPHKKLKGVENPIQRLNNDSPNMNIKFPSKRTEEHTNSLKHRRHHKRVKDTTLAVHDAPTKRSRKQDADSDDDYDPFRSNMKSGSSKKPSDGRKDNKNWTVSEVIKLVDGVSMFGVGKWTAIQKTFSGSPPCRTSLDIRDKWRNLIRTSAIRLKHMKEEDFSTKYGSIPLPKSLLEKVCELDRAQPYLRSGVRGLQKCRNHLVDSSPE